MIPKTLKKIELTVVTPCFCAGGDQNKAELRAASFRGELRWWFRCLGGSRDLEAAVFGSLSGKNAGPSSVALILYGSTPPVVQGRPWQRERSSRNTSSNAGDSSYITFFLYQGKKRGHLPVGQRFTLELRQLRPIAQTEAMALLELAWDCMCNLGAVGARKTRGLGAYAPVQPTARIAWQLLEDERVKRKFAFRCYPGDLGNYMSADNTTAYLRKCADVLRGYRRDTRYHPDSRKKEMVTGETVLGAARQGRQMSAVRFRPLLDEKGKIHFFVLMAPTEIVLGEKAKRYVMSSNKL